MPTPTRPRALPVLLWLAQSFIAISFAWAAWMKLTQPIAQLAAMWPWTGELPAPAVRLLGLVDLAGAVGIVLPALTGIRPGLTVPAAHGCMALQACALLFHASRGEWSVLPVNLVFFAVAAFVARQWRGRPASA
ncbi:DoxX family protein [uncultured Massilia sp.]|uniref:DoxX family protein n=1 Tax=uncultured Massilia sp. TaxID=169973 RepID=UPI0025E5EF5B|nr:DoxX family protein [uncultured Massilia sp.]